MSVLFQDALVSTISRAIDGAKALLQQNRGRIEEGRNFESMVLLQITELQQRGEKRVVLVLLGADLPRESRVQPPQLAGPERLAVEVDGEKLGRDQQAEIREIALRRCIRQRSGSEHGPLGQR